MLPNKKKKVSSRFMFKPFERQIIFKLIKKYQDLVEIKQYDPKSNRIKQNAWQDICQQYNRHALVQKVQAKQLKRFWDNQKARSKSKPEKQHELFLNCKSENNDDNVTGGDGGGGCEDASGTGGGSSGIDGDDCDVDIFNEIFCENEVGKDEAIDETINNDDDNHDNIFNQSSINCNVDGESSEKCSNKTNNQLGNDIVEIEKLLNPLISCRLKKLETKSNQQNELYQLQIQREQLQIHALKEEITRKNAEHTMKLVRDRQLHELKMQYEKDLYMQRLRNDQELHQQKLHTISSASIESAYPNIYK